MRRLKYGILKRLHVNQHVIRRNNKTGASDPVLTVKTSKENVYGHRVKIYGNSELIYRPEKPLSCGAKVWIETISFVEVFDDRDQ